MSFFDSLFGTIVAGANPQMYEERMRQLRYAEEVRRAQERAKLLEPVLGSFMPNMQDIVRPQSNKSIIDIYKNNQSKVSNKEVPYSDAINQAAARYNVDPVLLSKMAEVESSFNPQAVSPAGAQGLFQLMPGTANELGVDNPFDPTQSAMGGAKYYRQMLNMFGSPEKALLAYNQGPGRTQRGVMTNEGRNYVNKFSDLLRVISAPQQVADSGQTAADFGYGDRPDGTPKGRGFLGEIPMSDGSGRVMTELSVGVPIAGKEMDIPTVVPTLTLEELNYLRSGSEPTPSIIQKAAAFAEQRIRQGKPVFAQPGEEINIFGSQQVRQPVYPGSSFVDETSPGGTGIIGQDMATQRRAYLEVIKSMVTSGDPALQEAGIKMLSDMQNSQMQDIERTAIQKNMSSTNMIPGSPEYGKFVEEVMMKGNGQNININTGAKDISENYVPKQDLADLIDKNTGQPLNTRYPIRYSELAKEYPNAAVKGPGLTEDQSKNVSFSNNAIEALSQIEANEDAASKQALAFRNVITQIPIVGDAIDSAFINPTISAATQMLSNAAINFTAAINRRESGATVTPWEWKVALDRYIPVYGDTPELLKQKAINRRIAVKSMLQSSGAPGQARLKEFDSETLPNKYESTTKSWNTGTLQPIE